MGAAAVRVLLYCDANLNLLDGSSVWVQSVCNLLSAAETDVTLLLRAEVHDTRLLAPIESYPGVTVVRPVEEGLAEGPMLGPEQVVEVMRALDERQHFDVVLIRGRLVAFEAALSEIFDGRIWSYLLDIPQNVAETNDRVREEVSVIASASSVFLWQTDQLRDFAESQFPGTVGKGALLPPMAPRAEFALESREPFGGRPWRIGYMGKMAPLWLTLEMTGLPAALAARGERGELHMVGDKFNRDPRDPTYQERMELALRTSPGVVWHGGMPRQEAMRVASRMDIGLSLRGSSYDRLEIATKALEFFSLGVPVAINRTSMYEDALGPDYPLYAGTVEEAADVVTRALRDPDIYRLAVERGHKVGVTYGFDESLKRMRALLEQEFPGRLPE